MGRKRREAPVSLRLAPELREWLTNYTRRTGKSRNATINEALRIYQKITESD